MASSFPRNLILATEIGYSAIPNIYAVNIDSWGTFKNYLRQLDQPEVKAKFDTITVDTISILWDLCEKYICSQDPDGDKKTLADFGYGKGYDLCRKEFFEAFRKITLMGYGLVFIAHSENYSIPDIKDVEFIRPSLNKRPYAIVNQLVDVIGYIGYNDKHERVIYTRSPAFVGNTPVIVAGSRYQYMDTVIPFGYENLNNALYNAVQEEIKHGGKSADIENRFSGLAARPFSETMNEAREVFSKLAEKQSDEIMDKVSRIISNYFTTPGFRLSEAKEDQQDLVEGVINEMKALL